MGLTFMGGGTNKRPRLRDIGKATGEYASFATMRLHEGDDRAVLKPTRGMYAIGIIVLLASAIPWGMCLSGILQWAGESGHGTGDAPFFFKLFSGGFWLVWIAGTGFGGVLFTGLALLLILTTAGRRVVFDKFNKTVIDQKGLLGRKREEIPLRDLAGLEVLETNQSSGPGWKLELVLGGSQNRRLTLMHHAKQELLLADAQQLARFLKTPLREVSLVQQAKESGDWTLAVPQSPLSKSSANFKTVSLKTLGNGDLAFVPSVGMRVFWWVFLLVGVGTLLAVGLNQEHIRSQENGLIGLGVGCLFGMVFALVGGIGLAKGKTITISRMEGRIYKPGRKGFDIPIKGLKGVQLDFVPRQRRRLGRLHLL